MEPVTKTWELSKEFVETELVHEAITDFKVGSATKVGDNVSGELLSISVTTLKGQKIPLVFKIFPEDPEQLNYVRTHKVFRLETTVYRNLFPSLRNLLHKAQLPTNLPVPRFVAAHNNELDDYLCLEDVRPLGFKMLDKHFGLGFQETSIVLQALARFHALTYYLLKYEGEKYFENNGDVSMLAGNMWTRNNVERDAIVNTFGGATTVGIEFVAREDPPLAEKVRWALGNNESAAKILKSTTTKTDEVYFPCIVHGDLWTNNILFKYAPDGKPDGVVFVDFQQTRRGNIYEDLQYFLLTSTTPTDRRQFLTQWLESYYSSFINTLDSFKSPKPLNFSRGFFIGEMWNCFLSGYAYMYFAIPFQLGIHTVVQGEIDEPLPQRPTAPPTNEQIATILHSKFRKWMERSPAAQQRLLEITREMEHYGLI